MKVRHATLDDALDVFALAKAMNKETVHFADFDFDDEKSMGFIIEHVNNPGMMLIVAEDDNGQVVGCMLATAQTTYFGKDVIVTDDAFYVLPEHRGKGTLAQFLMAYQQWAESMSPKFIHLGVSQGINDDRTIKSLNRAGYESFGTLLRRAG